MKSSCFLAKNDQSQSAFFFGTEEVYLFLVEIKNGENFVCIANCIRFHVVLNIVLKKYMVVLS